MLEPYQAYADYERRRRAADEQLVARTSPHAGRLRRASSTSRRRGGAITLRDAIARARPASTSLAHRDARRAAARRSSERAWRRHRGRPGPQLVDELLSKLRRADADRSRRSCSTTRSSCRRSPRRHRDDPRPGRALRGVRRRHGDRQRLHRAQRPRRAARALRGAGPRTRRPGDDEAQPVRRGLPHARSSTACRPPAASASASTGW